MKKMNLAFSPCPNDTFIFHGIVHGRVAVPGIEFSTDISDVEELNRNAMEGVFHVTKLSFHTYLLLKKKYEILDAGAALGFGCGPLLVARKGERFLDGGNELSDAVIAIPGEYTTAHLLLKLWFPGLATVSTRFDEIMPGVRDGAYDAGLIIHEGRFVYQEYGLEKIVDLGEWWEKETGHPIPLGCIAIRRDCSEFRDAVSAGIAASIDYAAEHPRESKEYIRIHAREMDENVISDHISLYVNEFSRSLGEKGMNAIITLEEMARCRGIIP